MAVYVLGIYVLWLFFTRIVAIPHDAMDAEKPHYDQLSVLSKHMCRNYTHQTVLRTLFRNFGRAKFVAMLQ